MIERIIDVSEEPVRMRVRDGLLVISRDEGDDFTLPLPEVGVLVVSHPQVTYTQAVLSGIAEAGGAFIACNGKRTPVGIMMPLAAHFAQGERFEKQMSAAKPTLNRLWQQIVKAKINAQARLLKETRGEDFGLSTMAIKVKSGDPENIEGQASRRYWPALFSDERFKRDRDAPDQNRHLNYGYAVLRAIICRAVCASGLHPSIGIHHHNRYDSFRLASDVMEPFRPAVDRAVVAWMRDNDPLGPMDKKVKEHLIRAMIDKYSFEGEERTLFDISVKTSQSLAGVYEGKRKGLVLPDI